MDRFDYKIRNKENYLSSGITPGDLKRPVSRGSSSSFSTPFTKTLGPGNAQFIAEPAVDDVDIAIYNSDANREHVSLYTKRYKRAYASEVSESRLIRVRYLQNGVYTVSHSEGITRVVTDTGPVSIKFLATGTEIYVMINDVSVQIFKTITEFSRIYIAPQGGVAYDKFVFNSEENVNQLIDKRVFPVSSGNSRFSPVSRDKLFDPVLLTADEMTPVEDYRVTSRKLTLANTAAAFYSDTTAIEKSIDAENWEPVDKVEYHGESAFIFRSKDPNFAVRYFDTNMDQFIVPGSTTSITGEVYKVGSNVGSYFSHDCYRIYQGGLTIESDTLTSVTILGYIPDELAETLNPTIDYGGTNFGKIHLYTFESLGSLTLEAEEIYIAGIGINVDHMEVMDNLTGASEMSYADEMPQLKVGQAMNGENEYAILDLQWNV